MILDKLRQYIRESTGYQLLREAADKKAAELFSGVQKIGTQKSDKAAADPLVKSVEERNYPYWKKAWAGTIKRRTGHGR